jgi:GNAT superfamily N-acetyltransferase
MAHSEWVALRDGASVAVGPLATGDENAIASWFAGLGPETRYARFFAPVKRLDPRTQSALARVDHVDHEAIAARASDGATIGIARYIRLGESTTAEVAVAVADAWRGQGIATVLLDRVAARARAVGIERLAATCLVTNERMIRLLRRIGPTTVGPSIAGIVDVRIALNRSPSPGREPVMDPVLRDEPSDAAAAQASGFMAASTV